MLPQEVVHLAEAYFAGTSILHLGSHQFHEVADSLEGTLKAEVFVLWFNPTATIKQRLDDRQQPPLNRTSQDAIVLFCERSAQEGTNPGSQCNSSSVSRGK